jgi:hypothetical protein
MNVNIVDLQRNIKVYQLLNKKIPYPPKINGYISSRLFKEQLSDFLIKKGFKELEVTNIVNSTAKRFKLYANQNNLLKAILREGERGKEQFQIELLQQWLLNRKTEINELTIQANQK